MAFDKRAYIKAQFIPRTADVRVEVLADWFGDSDPVWTVRGQTANEIARAADASQKHKNLDNFVTAISASNLEKINELRTAIGIADKDMHSETIRRIEQLVQCSIEPKVDLELAKLLQERHPVEFYIITNKIVELTGLGMDLKKPEDSGKTKVSKLQ